jgi:anaerobic selenocysteine-containing dehydrogenase
MRAEIGIPPPGAGAAPAAPPTATATHTTCPYCGVGCGVLASVGPDGADAILDPRRTPTCDIADLHLPLALGTDVALFVGLLDYLRREDALDWGYLETRCEGFAAAFPYTSAAEVFREHAALSGFENAGERAFDIGALVGLTDADYAGLAPLRWPAPVTPRPEPFTDGRFLTPSGKARFVPLEPRPPAHAPDASFPPVLDTGRVRDQWHTMTRTGKSAKLSTHRPEPTVEVHPEDPRRLGLREGGLAHVFSRWGEAVVRAALDPGQRRGSVFLPFHWNAQTASAARADALLNPVTDPLSGEPASKHAAGAPRPLAAGLVGPMRLRCTPRD